MSKSKRIHETQVQYDDACRLYGDDSAEAFSALSLLAVARRDGGDYRQAAKDFRRIVDDQREQLLLGETSVLRSAERLGRCLWEIKEYTSALAIQSEVLKVAIERWGANSDFALESAYKLVATLTKLGEFAHVQQFADEVINARLKDPGSDDFTSRLYLYSLADLYLYVGNYNVSLQLFRRAKSGGMAGGRALRLVAASALKIVNVRACIKKLRNNPEFDVSTRWRQDVSEGKYGRW